MHLTERLPGVSGIRKFGNVSIGNPRPLCYPKPMKITFIPMILLMSQTGFAKTAFSNSDPRSFDMVLTGVNGQPPPATTSLAFRKMIGQFVTDLDVVRYFQLAPPEGGGFHVCIEPQEPKGFDDILSALQAISAGSSARWNVTLVVNCDQIR